MLTQRHIPDDLKPWETAMGISNLTNAIMFHRNRMSPSLECSNDGSNKFLTNICIYLPDRNMSHLSRLLRCPYTYESGSRVRLGELDLRARLGYISPKKWLIMTLHTRTSLTHWNLSPAGLTHMCMGTFTHGSIATTMLKISHYSSKQRHC
jgi:hypothetical protein